MDHAARRPRPCSQRCINTIGHYRCECFPGYYYLNKEYINSDSSGRCLVAGPESPQLYLATDGEGLRGYDLNTGTLYPVWLEKEHQEPNNNEKGTNNSSKATKKRYRGLTRVDNQIFYLMDDPIEGTTTGFELNLDGANNQPR